MGRQCLPEGVGTWLPSLRENQTDWQQMLQSLAELYVRGVQVDWLGFDRDYARKKVVLPTYPFQRQRYWMETNHNSQKKQYLPKGNALLGIEAKSIIDWLYEVEWRSKGLLGRLPAPDFLLTPVEIEQKLTPSLKELITQIDAHHAAEIARSLDELSVDYIVQGLLSIGWTYKLGETFDSDAAFQRLGVVPSHRRLFKRLLQILAEVGILETVQQKWQVRQTLAKVNPSEKAKNLLLKASDEAAALTLLDRCGFSTRWGTPRCH